MNSSNEKNGQDQLRSSKKMNLHAQTCIYQENARGYIYKVFLTKKLNPYGQMFQVIIHFSPHSPRDKHT